MATTTSGLLQLNLRDAARGFLVAFITSVLATIGQSINAGTLPTLTQLKVAGIVGLTAGMGYLIKNLFTPATTVTPAVPPPPPTS